MAGLAVRVDQVAALRAVRKSQFPDPVTAASMAELAGADGVVVHLRQDRRHVKDRDVRILRNIVQSKLILEMASTSEMVGVALDIKPDLVTLVPERREEYTDEGGSVTVEVLLKNHDNMVIEVSVSDTGYGIYKNNLEKIFDKFKRIESGKETARGTGLGLSIAKHVITAHGGKIWAESTPGKGSNFFFTLPAG